MPSASVTTATAVNPGWRRTERTAKWRCDMVRLGLVVNLSCSLPCRRTIGSPRTRTGSPSLDRAR
jgi:hypothetical protein